MFSCPNLGYFSSGLGHDWRWRRVLVFWGPFSSNIRPMKGLNPGVAPLHPRAIIIALASQQSDFLDPLLLKPSLRPIKTLLDIHALKRNSDDDSHPAVATTSYHGQQITPRRSVFS
ncbi:hypothetical protein BJ165DRAFT_1533248 [Panaeolus papilionaceus]|nr:hypothetical protein BJ165DRAFT_1533248 [Panaeolus papilionaceus]